MDGSALFLGVDGGGTRCRARLCDGSGAVLGEGMAGPANIRLGLDDSMQAVLDATGQCLAQARLSLDSRPIIACLALAGATEPIELEAVRNYRHPFRQMIVTTDAHAACVGAHRGEDGGVVIVGTGTVAWAMLAGRHHRVGGWGFPVSDEGSGAWLGCEVVRRVLWAHDGRARLDRLAARACSSSSTPIPMPSCAGWARPRPREFAALAPLVVQHARQDDPAGCELMQLAAGHIDVLAERLSAIGVRRLALAGGLSSSIAPVAQPETKRHLVPAAADALAGALWLARARGPVRGPDELMRRVMLDGE